MSSCFSIMAAAKRWSATCKGFTPAARSTGLVLSRQNIGKLNALYKIAHLAKGSVIAYSDDDVYHPQLAHSRTLEVLDTFPNVGAVTGFTSVSAW